MEQLRLIKRPTFGRPGFGSAVSRALLERVAAGGLGPTFRLHRTDPVLAFGRQDRLSPGFERAVGIAREHGYAPILRLAGGRAAVFHEGTLELAHATPDPWPPGRTRARFEAMAELLVTALRRLGVDARVGEVPGEYCPGAYSVNARGAVKIAGLGQRLIAGGAHMGGVVVVEGGERIRNVLIPVYDALGLDWDPDTCGDVREEAPAAGLDQVSEGILAELAARYELLEIDLDASAQARAEELMADHGIEL